MEVFSPGVNTKIKNWKKNKLGNATGDAHMVPVTALKTLNAINLAKLLSFGEKDIRNGKLISHENAKKIFEKTNSGIKRYRNF